MPALRRGGYSEQVSISYSYSMTTLSLKQQSTNMCFVHMQPPLQGNAEHRLLHLNIDTALCVRSASVHRACTPTATARHPLFPIVHVCRSLMHQVN